MYKHTWCKPRKCYCCSCAHACCDVPSAPLPLLTIFFWSLSEQAAYMYHKTIKSTKYSKQACLTWVQKQKQEALWSPCNCLLGASPA
jgi:hypothetical protein